MCSSCCKETPYSASTQHQKSYHNQHAKSLLPLHSQQVVPLQTERGYQKVGVVKQPALQPRSYSVEAEGKQYREIEDISWLFQNRLLLNLLALQRPMIPPSSQSPPEHSPVNTKAGPNAPPDNPQMPPTKTPMRLRYGRTVKPNPKFQDFVAC